MNGSRNNDSSHRLMRSRIALISNCSLLAALIFIIVPLYAVYAFSPDDASVRPYLSMSPLSAHIAFDALNSLSSAASPKSKERISILFAGDMMFDRGVRTKIIADGEESVFASTTRTLANQYDLAIANLEGPITSSRSKTVDGAGRAIPGFSFTFPTSTAAMLKNSGIDIVSLANNHSYNFGSSGFRETTEWLRKSGIGFFGNAENGIASGQAGQIASPISTIHCIDTSVQTGKLDRPYCIGLIGYHALVEEGQPEILAEIKAMAAQKASAQTASTGTSTAPDFIVVFPHWGNEYQKLPTAEQKRLAHAWIDAGADIIVGAHPHIVESVELYKNKPIFYSLGNYIFDQYFSYDTTHALTIGLELSTDLRENDNLDGIANAESASTIRPALSLDSIRLMPIDITGTRVRLASDADRTKMLNEIVRISNGFIGTSTKNQILTEGEIAF